MSEALSAPRPAAADRSHSAGSLAFHLWMIGTVALVLLLTAIGCRLTQVHVSGVGGRIVADIVLVGAFQALPLSWHRKGRFALRDSSLCVLWAALLWTILPFTVDVASRLGRTFPLRDPVLARLDADLGVNIAAVARWSAQHWIGHPLDTAYASLAPLLILAFLVPGLTGRATVVKRLMVANLAAFAIGLPTFIFMPAIGPWYGEHFAPNRAQAACEIAATSVRVPAPYEHKPAGVICFPSFHVMWAIVCAQALASSFRRLRWPAWIVAGLIMVSTMTTGWHYFIDVLGGLVLAGLALATARLLVRDRVFARPAD
ncbi:MAG TPA: phosphatase PAP2 family protein [Terracidiphilus sp.]|nr:phosphatase PAP2 family protein [Terracidiphilus sp.]